MAEKNITTSSRMNHPIDITYIKMLETLRASLVYGRFGEEDMIPRNAGENAIWEVFEDIADQTTPLGYKDPTPVLPSKITIEAQIQNYGMLMPIAAWVDLTAPSSYGAKYTDIVKRNMDSTLDTLCRQTMAGAAGSLTCSNGSGTATFLNRVDIDSVVLSLLLNNVDYPLEMIPAGTGQGTSPVWPAFIGIAHTRAKTQLEAVSGFKPVSSYASPGTAMPEELGSTGNVRWLLTNKGYYDGSTYYYATILGKSAYGTVKIGNASTPLIYNPAEKGMGLHMVSEYGWKQPYVAKILREEAIYNLKFTV